MTTPARSRTLALLLLACAVGCSPRDGGDRNRIRLRVGGSESARELVGLLLERFRVPDPQVDVDHLPSTHSGAALSALKKGELDLAYVTREPTSEEREGLYLYPLARDPLVFAVHKGAGVFDLSTAQLRSLYAGKLRNWSELGGEDLPVVLLDRPDYTSSKQLLLQGPLANLTVAPTATVLEGPEHMDAALANHPGALGYTSLRAALAAGDRVDILRLDGVYPSADAVGSGAYRLTRPLLFAVRDEFGVGPRRLLDFIASPEGRRIIEFRALVAVRRDLLIAVPPMRNIVAIEKKYGGLARYLQERLGRPVTLMHQPSYGELVKAFGANRVDAAFLGSFTYLLARQQAGIEVLARPDYDGVSHYRGVLYVRTDSPYRSVEDLRGRRVAFAGKATTAGYVFPLYALVVRELPGPDHFFRPFFASDSHEGAIRAVLDGRADAAAVKDLVWHEMTAETPSLRGRLRALDASPPVPSNGFAVGPSVGPGLRDQIRGLLLSMHQSPKGSKALIDLGATRFLPTSDADYQNLYDMIEAVSLHLDDFLHEL